MNICITPACKKNILSLTMYENSAKGNNFELSRNWRIDDVPSFNKNVKLEINNEIPASSLCSIACFNFAAVIDKGHKNILDSIESEMKLTIYSFIQKPIPCISSSLALDSAK